jgi:hypothetical protein
MSGRGDALRNGVGRRKLGTREMLKINLNDKINLILSFLNDGHSTH